MAIHAVNLNLQSCVVFYQSCVRVFATFYFALQVLNLLILMLDLYF